MRKRVDGAISKHRWKNGLVVNCVSRALFQFGLDFTYLILVPGGMLQLMLHYFSRSRNAYLSRLNESRSEDVQPCSWPWNCATRTLRLTARGQRRNLSPRAVALRRVSSSLTDVQSHQRASPSHNSNPGRDTMRLDSRSRLHLNH